VAKQATMARHHDVGATASTSVKGKLPRGRGSRTTSSATPSIWDVVVAGAATLAFEHEALTVPLLRAR